MQLVARRYTGVPETTASSAALGVASPSLTIGKLIAASVASGLLVWAITNWIENGGKR